MARCADCGAAIYLVPALGKWGERPTSIGDAYKFTCRIFYNADDEILGADYHHPSGVAQQRLRVPTREGESR